MKKLIMLCAVLVLTVPRGASADHISIYSDGTGSSCNIPPGFNTTAAVVHKFSQGTIASRFRMLFPVGSHVFSFSPTAGFVPLGDIQTGLGVAYGQCLVGSFSVGTIVAILAPGPICMHSAIGFSTVNYVNCSSVELPADRGWAAVSNFPYCGGYGPGNPCGPVAVESSSWGHVKALYR